MKDPLAVVAAGLVLAGGWALHHLEPGPTPSSTTLSSTTSTVGIGVDDPVRRVAQTLAPTAPPTAARNSGTPQRLVIDALDVDAPVEPVGITPEGGQQVPHFVDTTGWWKDGTVPGDTGSAVVVGHTASAADGVFDRLSELAAGDEIRVVGTHGTVTFVVEETVAVSPERFRRMAAALYRSDGPSSLVLMTCGDWNGEEFESTVVVRAGRG